MRRRKFLELGAAAPLVPLLGCGGGDGGSGPSPLPPFPTGAELPDLRRLGDNSGTPKVFESNLTAVESQLEYIPNVPTRVLTYNGLTPGHLIEVNEGDTVRINFTNMLAQDSTIHWHGIPVPPSQDGLPQDPVPPGASKLYQFTLPRGVAGTFWYHPHPHVNSAEQIFRGLAGMFVIRPARDPLAAFPSKNLFITDLRLDTAAAIPPNTEDDRIDGREGNHLLVNGVQQPRISIRPGSIQRWRIVNATNARFLRLALDNHTFRLVGTDGGLLRSPVSRSEILLSPAERIEVLVEASEGGGTFNLLARPYDRHKIRQPGASAQVIVATLAYNNDSPVNPPRIPNSLRTIERLEAPVRQQRVEFNFNGSNQFMVNGRVFDPDRVDLVSRAGVVEEWEVENLAAMDHPFHIHQAQLQVVSRTEGGQTTNELLAWKDTFNMVPNEIVRFRIRFTHRGTNVFHCHILEHEAHGMMGVLDVT